MDTEKERTDDVVEETGVGDPLADSEPIQRPDQPEDRPDIETEEDTPEPDVAEPDSEG